MKAGISTTEFLYQAFVDVFNTLVENKDYFLDKIKGLRESDNPLRRYKAKQFSKIIAEAGRIDRFDVEQYFALTEKVVVHDEGRLMVFLLWAAVFADVGVSVIAILNAIRVLITREFSQSVVTA